jgi:hypothetical protein
MHTRFVLALLSSLLLVGQASAGMIAVFTEIYSAGGNNTGQIPVPGLGNWATLTWGTSPGPTVTVPAGQTSASQAVVGFWPVMQFSNLAQYQAQSSKVVTVPVTPVQLYVEVWDGGYGLPNTPVQRLFVNATVSGQVSPTAGLNTLNWQFAAQPAPVMFGDDTVVSINYQAVSMPTGVPQILFQDGTPPIGVPGPTFYPTLVDADVTVSSPSDCGGPMGPNATPEPSSAVLLAGLTLGGLVSRRCRRVVPAK